MTTPRTASTTDARKRLAENAAAPEPMRDLYPRVQGRCPTCGTASLFLGSGGYVTCSLLGCTRPDHASDVLDGKP